MTILVSYKNYSQASIAKRYISTYALIAGLLNDELSHSEVFIDLNNFFYNVSAKNESYLATRILDEPYKFVLSSIVYNQPSISQHKIAFSVARKERFLDNFLLKTDKPQNFTTSISSAFEITGAYLNETLLSDSFLNIPNDLKDYEEEANTEPEYEDYENLTRTDIPYES